MRLQLFGGLLVCGGIGCLLFLALRPPPKTQRSGSEFTSNATELTHTTTTTTTNHVNTRQLCKSAVQTFCRSFHLLPSKVMLCLLLACGFTAFPTRSTAFGLPIMQGGYANNKLKLCPVISVHRPGSMLLFSPTIFPWGLPIHLPERIEFWAILDVVCNLICTEIPSTSAATSLRPLRMPTLQFVVIALDLFYLVY
ncbi:hypothetical protein AHF37_10214 [Paragonimus kellicotti]|nr:hypothetical protein AHF37_10214 [Paragonimus kellicotti]